MLNTNPSQKINSWKYFSMLPLLVAFVFFFQVKVQAQVIGDASTQSKIIETHYGADFAIDANTSEKSLKTIKNAFKEEKIITEISKIKRNSTGEIIGIYIKMICEDGRVKELNVNQNSPIEKIYFYTNRLEKGLYDFGVKQITEKEEKAIKNEVNINPNDSENTLNLIIDKISSDIDLKGDSASLKERFNIDLKVNHIKRNAKGEIIELKLSYIDNKGKKGKTEQIRTIPIRPIFMKVYRKENGENEIGFYDNHEMKTLPKNDEKEKKITFIESLKDNAIIYVDDQFLMRKEDVQELDVNSLVSMKVLKDAKSLEKYNIIGNNEVVVIETNWTTKKPKTEDAKINYVIFTNDNGDELTYSFELNYFKVPQFPSVKITENSPILILNGVQQSNPLKTIDNIDFKKIKSVRVSNSKDEVIIGTLIEKIIISTK